MKPTAYLINPARAEIVEERALYETLHDGGIAGAASTRGIATRRAANPLRLRTIRSANWIT